MNEKALLTLEYDKIIEKLASRAASPMGKEAASALKPCDDIYTIRIWQKETSEAESMILRKGSLPMGGVKDIRSEMKRVAVGGVLNIEELLSISEFLYVCGKVCAYGKNEGKNENYEMLEPKFLSIQHAEKLEKEINRCIMNSQELADEASPKLSEIRRGMKISNDRIREQLNSIIHSQSYKTMLQDNVITIRSDRYCVPIKQEYRNSFPGMVHDQSSTGATVFIEPMSVVNLNNRIKELLAQEKIEINKILTRLSGMVAEYSDNLILNSEMLTQLDFIFAKGELSVSMNGTEPIFNINGHINIIKGRHPLLSPDTVVPTDIYLGKDFTILLVTGPNTGGKTVALKTVGLFTLMGQAGLHIPARDNSELSVFEEVFADIGDEQSIEQSLSTFSSHMSNIVRILNNVTDNSLVLLDELGAGTDPTEGAALAVAILQYLHDRKIPTAVTTHYSELKVYALSTEGVENASCEFDVETLKPTYRLLIGIPGKSNAFAISQRLGLADHIISAAKEVISQEDARFEDIITDLEISRKTVLLEKDRAEEYRREAELLKKEFEKQKQKLAEQKEKILFEAKEEARSIMRQAKDESDALLKEMRKRINENQSQKDIEAARQQIRDGLDALEDEVEKLHAPSKKLRPVPENLAKGDKVFIHSLNQSGIVRTPPDINGEAEIQAGIMRVKTHVSNLSLDETAEKIKPNVNSYARSVKAGKSMAISPEIDLRGCLVDEGIEKADKYLDDAYLSGLAQVTVIHGKGTGALRTAVHSHLKKHPHVKTYRIGRFGEGEDGVTIVEFK